MLNNLPFLLKRQILDVVGIVQKSIHSIKMKKHFAMVLKLDLDKAYDKVDRSFLQLVLLQIGIPHSTSLWIMSCVTSASFAVLVNGSPTSYFKGSRGIPQGCPLSPYLFLLIIEGLSLLLSHTLLSKDIKGVKVSGAIFVTQMTSLSLAMVLSKNGYSLKG